MAKPYKSRRKQLRKDIDDHYWPFCKQGVPHDPAHFVLTTFVCGDILAALDLQVHEVKRRLGLPAPAH